MPAIFNQRMTANVNGEFVVFIIGMRANNLWKVHKWLPVATAMSKMLKELYANPSLGLISHENWFMPTPVMIQYWKSFDHLNQYAKNRNAQHLPAWSDFNKKVADSGEVGIWHETYLANKGSYECIYHNMPKFGLAKVGDHIPASGVYQSAASRMRGDTRG